MGVDTRAARILIVRVGAMGDVLHGMPAVAALREVLPGALIGWAVEPRWAPLLQTSFDAEPRTQAMPLLDRVHPVSAKAWSKAPFSTATFQSVLALRKALRMEHYDLAIDLQGSVRSAVIARMSGATRVIGSATPREKPARFLYTERTPLHEVHVVAQAAEIVSAAVGMRLTAAATTLPYDAAAEAWCDGFLGADVRRVVFIAPTAGWGAKQWPPAKFAALSIACAQAGLRVLVNQAGPEDNIAALVVEASGGAAEPVDCSVSQLTALLRRMSLAVAGDTGPLHLAAALGVPVVALFGPTDPARNGPFGGPSHVLRSASSITDHRRHAAAEAGLASITTAEVLRAAGDLLQADIPFVCETAHAIR